MRADSHLFPGLDGHEAVEDAHDKEWNNDGQQTRGENVSLFLEQLVTTDAVVRLYNQQSTFNWLRMVWSCRSWQKLRNDPETSDFMWSLLNEAVSIVIFASYCRVPRTVNCVFSMFSFSRFDDIQTSMSVMQALS